MQAIGAAIVKAIPLLLGGGAASGAAAGASTLSTIGTIVSVGSGLLGTLYERNVAKNMAAVEAENAKRSIFTSQVEQQDRDLEAAAAMADARTARSDSGFAQGSISYQRADRRNRILARRDAERIRQGGELEAQGHLANAAAKKAEVKNLTTSLLFDTIGGAAKIGGSMIGNANRVNKNKVNELNRERIKV